MRRRINCGGAFRDRSGAFRVIGKVIRGSDARRLLYYLFGPGRANEHADPHLVAGFGDPAELEPERVPGRVADVRRLAGLLAQPLAALSGPGHDKPVWHCAVRAAPEDPVLADGEWARVAAQIMDQAGLAPAGDESGVRWVAVRHAPDHVHIVATLARQDGTRPRVWNDFYRVREACRQAEERLGLRSTAPADRTAARRPSRAETEKAARLGQGQAPRARLRREVSVAAGAARGEQDFLARLAGAGVLVRLRHGTTRPGVVTGYAVGLPGHTASGGGVIWYGGGKLAADLTLPRLRARWAAAEPGGPAPGDGLSPAAARAVLRHAVTGAAERAGSEAGFFAALRAAGVLVRLRFSETDPGQVTGYSVALPGHHEPDGTPCWHGGGRLAAGLALPRLRTRWVPAGSAGPGRSGSFRFTAPERDAIYQHAARQAAAAAEHVRGCAGSDPARAADAAWAAGDALHVAARALRSPELRRAADAYDRAARAGYGRIPAPTPEGRRLRAAARLLALQGAAAGSTGLVPAALMASLAGLVVAVAELREVQQHAAQAAAARQAAERLYGQVRRVQPPGRLVPQPAAARGSGEREVARVVGDAFPDQPAARAPGLAGETPVMPQPRPAAAPRPGRHGPGR
jgi:hypothetical protein